MIPFLWDKCGQALLRIFEGSFVWTNPSKTIDVCRFMIFNTFSIKTYYCIVCPVSSLNGVGDVDVMN